MSHLHDNEIGMYSIVIFGFVIIMVVLGVLRHKGVITTWEERKAKAEETCPRCKGTGEEKGGE